MTTEQQTQVFPEFKIVYLFDASTGEYAGEYQAQHSPLDEPGTYIKPVCSTEQQLPVLQANEAALFVGGAWSVSPDYREQTVYNQVDNSALEITALGPLPTGYALTQSPAFLLQKAFSDKGAYINNARFNACIADVTVTISGVAHTFQADISSVGLLLEEISMVVFGVTTCTPVWRSSDNINVAVTIDDLKAIAAAIATQKAQAYEHSFALKDALIAAYNKGDLAGINSITW